MPLFMTWVAQCDCCGESTGEDGPTKDKARDRATALGWSVPETGPVHCFHCRELYAHACPRCAALPWSRCVTRGQRTIMSWPHSQRPTEEVPR
jgi:hypothetical protein